MKVGWVSLGCPKNLVDTEYMMGLLQKQGFTPTPDPSRAEIMIINTCTFIEPATRESIDAIIEFAQFKKARCKLLVVTGCLAQRHAKRLRELIPEVDLWLGTGEYARLPEVIRAALQGETGEVYLEHPGWIDLPPSGRVLSTGDRVAYVKIAEGCDHRCAYCVIPSIRGAYRSRKPSEIQTEIQNLIAGGVKEVILVAQDTTAYGIDLEGRYLLPELLATLDGIEGEFWLRILYTYPSRISEELLEVIRDSRHICHYLDLPLQHIDERILRAMGRNFFRDDVLKLIAKIRKTVPDMALRTTFILGFPGETKEEFEKVKAFLTEARFDWVGAFPYYREKGTRAAEMKNQVHHATRKKRAREILEIQKEISLQKNRSLIGREITVLMEREKEPGLWSGRSYREAPEIDGEVEVTIPPDFPMASGFFLKAAVTGAEAYTVRAEMRKNLS